MTEHLTSLCDHDGPDQPPQCGHALCTHAWAADIREQQLLEQWETDRQEGRLP